MDKIVTVESKRKNPKLGRIRIYPFKSLPGIECTSARFTPSGTLQNDRRFAFVHPDKTILTAKTDARVHRIQLTADQNFGSFMFVNRESQSSIQVTLGESFQPLEDWISQQFETPLRVCEDAQHGFPDDLTASGPTLISQTSLALMASWYPGVTEEQMRTRLRTNLEIEGVPAFWEDQLCPELDGRALRFEIGSATLLGSNPCQRCTVPSRNQTSGVPTRNFAAIFREQRQRTLPSWAPRSQFNHFYRAAINTKPAFDISNIDIHVGDFISANTSMP